MALKYWYKERGIIRLYHDADIWLTDRLKSFKCFKYDKFTDEWFAEVTMAKEMSIVEFLTKDGFLNEKIERPRKLSLPINKSFYSYAEVAGMIETLPLLRKPRGYQVEAVQYYINHPNSINGYGVGLGKTTCAILCAEILDAFPCLVISPSTVKSGWVKEWGKVVKDRSVSIIDVANKVNDFSADVTVINFDVLSKRGEKNKFRFPEIGKTKYKMLIIDEVHYLKNGKSIRSKMVTKLASKIKFKLGLTGTFAMNRPIEIISILRIMGQFYRIFESAELFEGRYCNGVLTQFGFDAKGAHYTKELYQILSHYCYIRKEKRDVMKELPDIIEQINSCPLSNEKIYRRAETDFISFLEEEQADEEKIEAARRAEHLVRLMALRRLCVEGKLSYIELFINEWIEANEGKKLLVFGIFKEPLYCLAEKMKALCITGSLSLKDKLGKIESFKNDESQNLLFANIQTIGTGVDGLQECCSDAIFIELPHRPSDIEQAIGRLDRQGQKESMNIYYLLSDNTIDTDIYEAIYEKSKIVNNINRGTNDDQPIFKDIITTFQKRINQ